MKNSNFLFAWASKDWVRSCCDYFSIKRSKSQIAELDGLRGLAILLVFLRHSILPFWGSEAQLLPVMGWDVGVLFANGWIGVDLFFVLSGFLISTHLMRMGEKPNEFIRWKSYFAKRLLRIVPAYYAVLFLVVAGAFPFYPVVYDYVGLRLTYHLFFLQDYLPANFIVVFWSLGVEEKFYVLAPILVLGISTLSMLRWRVLCVLGIVAIGLVLRIVTYFQYPDVETYQQFFPIFRSRFHMTLDPILFGVVLAFLFQEKDNINVLKNKRVASIVYWSGVALLVLLMTTTGLMDTITWWDKTLQPLVIALSFAAITYGLLFGARVRSVFRSDALFFFARISYCLYLVHLGLSPLAMYLTEIVSPSGPHILVFIPIFLSVSVVGALLLHYSVEKPFLILKSRID